MVQLVKDNAYDIIGMNEIRSIGNQHDDMNGMMAEAGFDVVEGNSTEANACYNNIYYKRDLFQVLDCGVYYLSPDGLPRLAWDMNNSLIRFTTWAKFQAKHTGDVFYFFSTHHDVSGSFARYEETRMNVDSIRGISGSYPAFFAGDFNTSAGDVIFYNYVTAYMTDCRMAAQNVVAPIGDGTLCHHMVDGVEVWDSNYSAVRLDYIFAKGADCIDEYVNVNTSYPALHNECPSDHFAIQATVTFGNSTADNHIIHFNPERESLQEAIDRCAVGGTVFLPQGKVELSAPLHIAKSITLEGKRLPTPLNDQTAKQQNNPKTLEGENQSTQLCSTGNGQVIIADALTAVTLRNIDINGGYSATDGGGIYTDGCYLGLFDCSIHDCHATRNGAAVYAGGQLEINSSSIYNNVCEGNGAAFYTPLVYWHQSVTDCRIYGNRASVGAAGFLGGFSYVSITGNSIYDNEATVSGVLHLERTGAKSFATLANNTIANNTSAGAGAAVETYQPLNSSLAIVNNTIVGNHSKVTNGCAIYVKAVATANIYSNIIAGNMGGDIAFGNSSTMVKNVCNVVSDEDCTAKLNIMLDGHIDSGEFIPSINEQGFIPVKLPYYGDCCINDVTAQMLDEKTFMGDVDNNAEMIQYLTTDQTGRQRRTDGTSTRGAVETGISCPWDGTTIEEPTTIETGAYKGFYLITKPAELAWISTMTETATFDRNLYIATDIDLGNHPWKPIGVKFPFCGSIEGNDRLISGINISATDGETAALIANTNNRRQTESRDELAQSMPRCEGGKAAKRINVSAYINNLRLSGKITAKNATYVASLVGKATALRITRIHSAIDVEVAGGETSTVGCIIGDATGTEIAGCSYSGRTTINGKAHTGTFAECNITSVYCNATIQGTIENCISAPTALTFQVGGDSVATEQLHSGELTRQLNDCSPLGYFGQDMSKRNSVPVTRTQQNTVYQTRYIVGDTLYHLSYNNHTLTFPSDPKVEGFIFLGWIDTDGNRMTSSSIINSDTLLTAHFEPLEKWDGTSIVEPMKIDNADSPYNGWYQITKPTELAWVAQKTKTAAFDGNLYIANDIDLNNCNWTPIGYNYNFNGSIEGNGYTIRNINMYPSANAKCYGFIGQTNNSSATISNLNIIGTMLIETSSKSANIGGLIGKANGMAAITNCHSAINITMKKGSLVSYLGGIIGLIKSTDIVSCSYFGTMSLEGGQVAKGWGGLVGTFNSTVEGDEGGLRYSWFSGKIISTTTVKPTYGAALVGYPSLSGGTCKIENCYACGVFSATTKPTNFGVIYAKKGTGTITSNNYNVGLTGNTSDDAISATEDQLNSGELCYLLNDGNTNEPFYYQNIDNGMKPDSTPLADASHGIVYKLANGTFSNFAYSPQGIDTLNPQSSTFNFQPSPYNLNGIRVSENYKGIVIAGRKKYLVK